MNGCSIWAKSILTRSKLTVPARCFPSVCHPATPHTHTLIQSTETSHPLCMQTISRTGSIRALSADNEDCFSTDAAFLCNNIHARKWMDRALNASSSTPPAIHLSARVAGAVSRTEGWEGRVIERGRTSFIMPLSLTIPPRNLHCWDGGLMRISPSPSVLFPHPNISPHISSSKQRDPHLPSCSSCPNLQGIPSPLHKLLLGWHILTTRSHLELFTYTARVHKPCHRRTGTTNCFKAEGFLLKGFISVPLVLWNGVEKIMMFLRGQGLAG